MMSKQTDDDDDDPDADLILEIERVLSTMSGEEFGEICKVYGVDDPKKVLESIRRAVKKRDH